LARRKLREIQAKLKVHSGVPSNGSPASYLDQAQKEKALQSMQQMSSAQIVSASAIHNKTLPLNMGHTPVSYGGFWQPGIQASAPQDVKPFCQSPFGGMGVDAKSMIQNSAVAAATPAWQGRAIATQRLRLMEFTAMFNKEEKKITTTAIYLFTLQAPFLIAIPNLNPLM
jgi:transcriptional enhancer factor